MTEAVRFGVIGTGMMGTEHLRNLLALPGADIVAASDPNPEPRQWARWTVGDDHPVVIHDTTAGLLARDDLDAVVIASPNFTHAAVLDEVFVTRPDLHVMVEKPLCTTVADCVRVIDAAAARPGLVWVGLEYRYMPTVARFLEEARGGAAGRLHTVFVREHRFPFLVKVDDWNRFNRNTGGTLVEKCCHFFDLMRVVAGADPVRVLASGGQAVNHLDERYDGEVPDLLDHAFVLVDFANGVRGCLDLCMFAEASRNEQEIVAVGDRGKLEALVPEGVVHAGERASRAIRSIDASTDVRIRHEGFHHGASYLELAAFVGAIREGAAPAVTAVDGAWSVATGVAAHRSIDEARAVTLEEVFDGGRY